MPDVQPHLTPPDNGAAPSVLDHVPGDNETPGLSDQIDPAEPEGGETPPAGQPEGGTPPAPVDPIEELRAANNAMRDELRALNERFETRAGEQEKEDAPAAPKEMTPDEWVNAEKSWGFFRSKDENNMDVVSIDPRKIMQAVAQRIDYAYQEARKYADQIVHGNVSDIRFESTVADMARKPEFSDVRSYTDAIKKYLADRYPPKERSNPKFIEDGLYWAKGRNMKNVINKIKDNKEISKTIVRPGTPGSKPAAAPGRLTPESMTAEQRVMAEATFRGLPKAQAYKEFCALY